MLRDAAVARIQQGLGFRGSSYQSTAIVTALQDVQVELEMGPTLPWFLESEILSVSTQDEEERLALPDGFIKEIDDGALWYYDGTATSASDVWTELKKDELEYLRKTYPGEGIPSHYNLQGEYMRLFPTPDASTYTLKLLCYLKDTVLSANVENKWLEHTPRLLIGLAGVELAGDTRDQSAIDKFMNMASAARLVLANFETAREEAGQRRVMGGPD
jgi:hypothetical protein